MCKTSSSIQSIKSSQIAVFCFWEQRYFLLFLAMLLSHIFSMPCWNEKSKLENFIKLCALECMTKTKLIPFERHLFEAWCKEKVYVPTMHNIILMKNKLLRKDAMIMNFNSLIKAYKNAYNAYTSICFLYSIHGQNL